MQAFLCVGVDTDFGIVKIYAVRAKYLRLA